MSVDVFNLIIDGVIPSKKIYEDDECIVILDINPIKKGHSLIIPKNNAAIIEDLDNKQFTHIMKITKIVSKKIIDTLKADATNIMINNGKEAGQEVPHVHVHVIPRYKLDKGINFGVKETYEKGEIEKYQKILEIRSID